MHSWEVTTMKRIRLFLLATVLFTPLLTTAQEKREEIPGGFRAYVVNEPRYGNEPRNRTGKMQDLVCDHGLSPVLAVFSRTIPSDATHPLNTIVAKQDQLVDDYLPRRFGAFVVFLALKDEFRKDESRDDRKKEIDRFVTEAMPKRTTIGLAEATETPDGAAQALIPAQVTGMGITPDDDLVIVLYYRFDVIKRWKFKADAPPTAETLKEITAEAEKLLGKPRRRSPNEAKVEPKAPPAKVDPKEEPKKEEPKKDE